MNAQVATALIAGGFGLLSVLLTQQFGRRRQLNLLQNEIQAFNDLDPTLELAREAMHKATTLTALEYKKNRFDDRTANLAFAGMWGGGVLAIVGINLLENDANFFDYESWRPVVQGLAIAMAVSGIGGMAIGLFGILFLSVRALRGFSKRRAAADHEEEPPNTSSEETAR